MSENTKNKLKTGFTVSRIGIDLCWSALFVVAVYLYLALVADKAGTMNLLFVAMGLVVVGLVVFFMGRVMVGAQSRALYSKANPSEEERLFAKAMYDLENKASDANLASAVSRNTNNKVDDVLSGAAGMAVAGSYFSIGKKYMGANVLVNRIGLIVGLLISLILLVRNL